jgi:hypothetical protein
MKTALAIGGAAVGLYLIWRWCNMPAPIQPTIAGSAMTSSGAGSSVAGTISAPGLLPAPGPVPRSTVPTLGSAARNLRDVLASDVRAATVAPAPNDRFATTAGGAVVLGGMFGSTGTPTVVAAAPTVNE